MASKDDMVQERKPTGASELKPEELWRMVAEAAYFRAEQRGFQGGDPAADWLEAEAEIETMLAETKSRLGNKRRRSRPERSATT